MKQAHPWEGGTSRKRKRVSGFRVRNAAPHSAGRARDPHPPPPRTRLAWRS